MKYLDLSSINNITEQSRAMINTVYGISAGYDIVKIKSTVYCMNVKAIKRVIRNVVHARRNDKPFIYKKQASEALEEYREDDVFIVNYIRGNIYIQDMRGLIMDYIDEIMMNTGVR